MTLAHGPGDQASMFLQPFSQLLDQKIDIRNAMVGERRALHIHQLLECQVISSGSEAQINQIRQPVVVVFGYHTDGFVS
jgi:hypothetical protein